MCHGFSNCVCDYEYAIKAFILAIRSRKQLAKASLIECLATAKTTPYMLMLSSFMLTHHIAFAAKLSLFCVRFFYTIVFKIKTHGYCGCEVV
jgi:hypothetical protein